MDSDERRNEKKNRYALLGNSKLLKSVWIRPFGLQIDTINEKLLDYNAYIICFCGPFLYFILYFL